MCDRRVFRRVHRHYRARRALYPSQPLFIFVFLSRRALVWLHLLFSFSPAPSSSSSRARSIAFSSSSVLHLSREKRGAELVQRDSSPDLFLFRSFIFLTDGALAPASFLPFFVATFSTKPLRFTFATRAKCVSVIDSDTAADMIPLGFDG